jgi:hypothetical protein
MEYVRKKVGLAELGRAISVAKTNKWSCVTLTMESAVEIHKVIKPIMIKRTRETFYNNLRQSATKNETNNANK